MGSTPTGVTDYPTAGSDYILFYAEAVCLIQSFVGWSKPCPTACCDYIQYWELNAERRCLGNPSLDVVYFLLVSAN